MYVGKEFSDKVQEKLTKYRTNLPDWKFHVPSCIVLEFEKKVKQLKELPQKNPNLSNEEKDKLLSILASISALSIKAYCDIILPK